MSSHFSSCRATRHSKDNGSGGGGGGGGGGADGDGDGDDVMMSNGADRNYD